MALRMSSATVVLVTLSWAMSSWPVSEARRVVPAIYVFGDSTADVGNNNYLPSNKNKVNFRPYGIDFPGHVPTGRFCNGYVGVDFIAMRLGFKKSPPAALSVKKASDESRGVSFASGGSGIFDTTGQNVSISMNEQIELFKGTVDRLEKLRGPKHARLRLSKSIFLFSTFNNDLFAIVNNDPIGAFNETIQDQFVSFLSTLFQQQLEGLYGLGMRKMVLFGTGPVGCPPALRARSPTGDCLEILNHISQKFNVVMKDKMKALGSKLQGFKYSYVNSYNITGVMLSKAAEYGFKVIKNACCGDGFLNAQTFCLPNSTVCSNRDEYFSWDFVHPTQANYKRFINLTYSGLPGLVEPITLQELVS